MIVALLLAAAAPAAFQDIAALDRAVAGFTGHALGEEGGARTPIDARLRLRACPMAAIAWRSDAHDAVTISCTGPDWRLFVPVRRSVPVSSVAAAAAPRVVPPVKAEPVIRRGDPVVIEAGSEGFAISREGVAMADAAPGARFLVRVEDAKTPVQAMALAAGRATLPGWGD
jgi:flagella basal body P-ring formation protein FlgA